MPECMKYTVWILLGAKSLNILIDEHFFIVDQISKSCLENSSVPKYIISNIKVYRF